MILPNFRTKLISEMKVNPNKIKVFFNTHQVMWTPTAGNKHNTARLFLS